MAEQDRVKNPGLIVMALTSMPDLYSPAAFCPSSAENFEVFILKIIPHGWYYKNYVNYCDYLYKVMREGFDIKNNRLFTSKITSVTDHLMSEKILLFNLFPKIYNQRKTVSSIAFRQTLINCYRVACGIEKYRIINKHIPEQLDSLVPEFIDSIPLDIIDGKPLRYKAEKTGDYTNLFYWLR